MHLATDPLLPGFHPDPSVVAVDGAYYLVTSTFEYLPGIPVHRSTDLVHWERIGHVVTRPEQADLADVPTPGGVWAPTIRHRDGLFHVIVTVMFAERGCVVFTATDPAGPWSDGTPIPAVDGIDPDLAWDDGGTAVVTFASWGRGIRQVRVDLATGLALEEPRSIWSGTGLHAPEGPHLHRRGDWWYLVVAEGGTERGHAVSIARGRSPLGPFTGCPDNPVLSARSTDSPVQNVGHADVVRTPDGGTALVVLGVRPVGFTRSFSPLGRETFVVDARWTGDWPRPQLPSPPAPTDPREVVVEGFAVAADRSLSDDGWIAVRQLPEDVAEVGGPGQLVLTGDGSDLSDRRPRFVGRRQRGLDAVARVRVDASAGTGGLAARHTEEHWFAVEVSGGGPTTTVRARARLAGLEHAWEQEVPAGELELVIRSSDPAALPGLHVGGDRVQLAVVHDGEEVALAELDGRYWSFETTESFTGRVVGLYARRGAVVFTRAEGPTS